MIEAGLKVPILQGQNYVHDTRPAFNRDYPHNLVLLKEMAFSFNNEAALLKLRAQRK
jgi:hypothetical protein